MTNRGVPCTYLQYPPSYHVNDELVVIFTNDYHSLGVCGNAHQDKYKDEYVKECNELLEWFEGSDKVICISNIIKFGTPYMAKNYKALQRRYDKLNITKQIVHGKSIGELINPNRKQIRYKGIDPIKFNIIKPKLYDPKHIWVNKHGKIKQMQQGYINIIYTAHDVKTRRKLRYIPYYTVFSELFQKLKKRGEL